MAELVLSDRQQKMVLDATFALDSHERHAFMTALASLLTGRAEVGDGELFRLLRELQREHYQFPSATHGHRVPA
jgi:hypothetical protein